VQGEGFSSNLKRGAAVAVCGETKGCARPSKKRCRPTAAVPPAGCANPCFARSIVTTGFFKRDIKITPQEAPVCSGASGSGNCAEANGRALMEGLCADLRAGDQLGWKKRSNR